MLKAAQQGVAKAEYSIGLMYTDGRGVSKNLPTAITWIQKAADQGHAGAETWLADGYYNALHGLPVQKKEALKLYRRAAQGGNQNAQFRLGQIYESGAGVRKDHVQAHMWYSLASLCKVYFKPGPKESGSARDRLAAEMTLEQLDKSRHLSSDWLAEHRNTLGYSEASSPLPTSSTSADSAGDLSGSRESAGSGGRCPATLAYLAPKLPQYDDPQLTAVRSSILQTRIADVMQRSRALGYTPQSAAKAALQQSAEFQKSMSQADSCLRDASATPDADVAAVKSGRYSFRNRGSSVSAQCAKAWIADYYGYILNRETAVALSCLSEGAL
jgi:hypothetical protein